jgi:murein DD-endopeptidase MepM/ murein hydrolase activator NlpD
MRAALMLVLTPGLSSAQSLPPLPDTSGFGVHVLALARAPDGAVWVGTYGQGIYVLPSGTGTWEHIGRSADTAAHSISWDFVHALGFGPAGAIWYGTVGNGWGVSTDGGKTWRNWAFTELGPEWQYVTPNGIVTRGDTVYVATANGIKRSPDRGATWAEITDSAGARTAHHGFGGIASHYLLALAVGPDGSLWAAHLRGLARSLDGGRTWTEFALPSPCDPARCVNKIRALAVEGDGVWVGTERGLYRLDPARGLWVDRRGRSSCGRGPIVKKCRAELAAVAQLELAPGGDAYAATADGVFRYDELLNTCDPTKHATAFLPLSPGWYAVGRPTGLTTCRFDQGLALVGLTYRAPVDTNTQGLRHTWFQRPIALGDQPYIDQTYRYSSTMGGALQQHQGVEFNAPDGTPVHAIGDGVVVFAGAAEAGALTVAIRHDRKLKAAGGQRVVFSTYYHNSKLFAEAGRRVRAGEVIAAVGNTGRATNDHLHLEVHAAPGDSVALVVDPNERFPPYTTNPELWIAPLPGAGVVAGQVWDVRGQPARQARIFGLTKAEPQETPFSYIETYGERGHPDPAYQEHFAVGDVPPGDYTLAVAVAGQRLIRRVRVEANRLTWVVFSVNAH